MSYTTDLDEYEHRWLWRDSSEYRIEKIDRVWRVLKYGSLSPLCGEFSRISYGDYHVIHSAKGPAIVSAYEASSLPSIGSEYENTKHATSKMVERDISTDERRRVLQYHIPYDRVGDTTWKILGRVNGKEIIIVVDVDTESVVTMWVN